MLKPLDDIASTVQLIMSVSDTGETEVRRRLAMEVREIGTNVYQSLTERRIPMHIASAELDQFYRDSDAFLYETTVWNTCSAKQRMRSFISSRLDRLKPKKADVFCFGDGLGFDSTWLALQGHRASYFEPSLRCQQYADQVFQRNKVRVTELASLENIAPGSLDVVVCLDVLEHVPQPQNLAALFHTWLKPDGLLFVHAPFWCLHWTRSTHLRENRHLSGDLTTLYHQQHFREIDASIFWDPIALEKSDNPTPNARSLGATTRLRTGQMLLAMGRWNSVVHNHIARKIARPPANWRQEFS